MLRRFCAFFISSLIPPASAEMITVPDFNGKSKIDAEALADEVGVTLLFREVEIALPQNSIYDQIPAEGAKVAPQSCVLLWLSLGLRLPDLIGITPEEAKQSLKALDVTYEITEVGKCQERKSIIAQSPEAGTLVDTNNTIVFLQNGFFPTAVPKFSGRSYGAYVDDLKQHEFVGVEKTIQVIGGDSPRGVICESATYSTTILAVPMQGQVACPGTTVEIHTQRHSYKWSDCRAPGMLRP